jgi:hypothetical protein
LVGRALAAIAEGCPGIPVTVKCRIGVDHFDTYEFLCKYNKTSKGDIESEAPQVQWTVLGKKCHGYGFSDVVIVFFLFRIRCRDDHLYMECVFSEYCQLWLGLEHIDIMIIKFEIGGTTLCSQQVGCCSLANSRII